LQAIEKRLQHRVTQAVDNVLHGRRRPLQRRSPAPRIRVLADACTSGSPVARAQRRPAFCSVPSPLLANEEDQSWPACYDCIFLLVVSFQSLSRAKIDWNAIRPSMTERRKAAGCHL
jgi:hypothetical protein